MQSERTVWAEGMGFPDEQVEALTEIAEEATRRCRTDERATEQPDLMTSDLEHWAAELDRFGFEDLATKVREIELTADSCPPLGHYSADCRCRG
jgi:hypothetical protein